MAKEPGQVAVDFLEKVREGRVDLAAGADTALSPHITESKRKLIEESIRNLSPQIGKGKLTAGQVRSDGDFAAVMVTHGDGMDESQLQVYPVALVKGENGWRAAPMLASFENAVAAYTVPMRERLYALEAWMMQQRVLEIESLTKRSTELLKAKIKSSVPVGFLTDADPGEILDRFQKAYSADRQPEVLAYLGGYSDKWPSDWDLRLEAMRNAVSPKVRGRYPWRLLASPDVIRVVVDQSVDKKEALISLACLDSEWVGQSQQMDVIHLVHFSFRKDEEGNWRLDLPESLLQDEKDTFLAGQGLDGDLLEIFPEQLRKAFPAKFAKSFEDAEREVIRVFEDGEAFELLQWVHFGADSKKSRDACVLALRDRWSLRAHGVFGMPVRMGWRVEGDWAVAGYHWLSLGQIDHMAFRPLFFRKMEKGWVWVPGSIDNVDPAVGEIFTGWMKGEQMRWQELAKKQVLESVIAIKRLDLAKETEEAEVMELAQKWSSALRKGKISELLRMSARLGDGSDLPRRIYRNLSYDLTLAQRVEGKLTGLHRIGKWTAVGFIHQEGEDKVFSLMLVVPTEEGLRVLPEIDLISDGRGSRKFLNKVSLDLLQKHVSVAELEEIKGLFEELEQKVR